MPINFIPNDPGATAAMPMRQQTARKVPTGTASVELDVGEQKGGEVADPGTVDFLYWQVREAILAALEMWTRVEGPVPKWARCSAPRSLELTIDAGSELNAYYDGQGVRFFHYKAGKNLTYSGASTEAASHEFGHALLDSIRPDLWQSNYTEVAAFHEAFADCVALLTQLDDQPTRMALLKVPGNKDLSKPSFFEAIAEDLSAAVKAAYGASHPAAEPRHALNTFQWALPESLPETAPPKTLCSEVHSFARIFVGCFYDLLRLVFTQSASTEANLLKASDTVAKLLIAGVKNAPMDPRFYRSVGRAMLTADDAQNKGKTKPLITKAFAQHGIALGEPAAAAPVGLLAGAAPKRRGKSMIVANSTVRDLRERLDATPGRAFEHRSLHLGPRQVSELVYPHRIKLDRLGKQMRGVVAVGHRSTLVGESNKRAALIGPTTPESVAEAEVLWFVGTLMKMGRVRTQPLTAKRVERISKGPGKLRKGMPKPEHRPTHHVVRRGTARVLERLCFACGCPVTKA
ncbi:MAG TPA: M36 family metallopeptidase [Reyranella sp.]|nr:M36 family metallopeptidase [Reyranella sp.]